MLKIDLAKQASRFVDSREPKHRRQITSRLIALQKDPLPNDSESVKKSKIGERRATTGEYRIIYRFDDTTLYVDTIGKRNDAQVYRRRK